MRVSALHHELSMKDALLDHLRTESLRNFDLGDEECKKFKEQVTSPVPTKMANRQECENGFSNPVLVVRETTGCAMTRSVPGS